MAASCLTFSQSRAGSPASLTPRCGQPMMRAPCTLPTRHVVPRRHVASAKKRSVRDLSDAELSGKTAFVRADLNVPLDGAGMITDDTRIRAAAPTLRLLLEKGCKVVLASHLGRPKSGPEDKFRLAPVAPRLSELLGQEVATAPDCVGPEVRALRESLAPGRALLLENVRFHKEETKNDLEFARQLAEGSDFYVNDAFGSAHRAHASTVGVTKFLSPNVAGLLLERELEYLDGAVSNPARPFVAIVGGSKVSSKIGVIRSLLSKVDAIILGGGMTYTFSRALGRSTGDSIVEEDKLELARELMAAADVAGVQLLLPVDVTIADRFAEDARTKVVPIDAIPDDWQGLDVGTRSIHNIVALLKTAKTVIWNGPLGVFEMKPFSKGTYTVAETLAGMHDAVTIVGGGDSVAAVQIAGLGDKMTHISTGGGASLELLEGKVLPGVAALDDAA